jgi:hypothetical protein
MPDVGVRPIFSYSSIDWLQSLPAYNQSAGPDSLLDLARLLQESGAFYWKGWCLPTGTDTTFAALTSFETSLQVEPGSLLIHVGGFSDNAAGFKLQIFERGAKQYLFHRTFCFNTLVAPDMRDPTGTSLPFGPFFLSSPVAILHPGELTLEITNLATVQATIQVLLGIAVLISDLSVNAHQMKAVK